MKVEVSSLSAMERQSQPERLSCPGLPLAVYREVAAHLRQVQGVAAELVVQTATPFSYARSQIEALCLSYPLQAKAEVEAILQYYAQRHGQWQREVNSHSV
jgi:hypothetical protein